MRQRRGFTLVEMLVAVAVICLFLMILTPSFRATLGIGRNTQSKAQLHEIGHAFLRFTTEHRMYLPGCWQGRFIGPEPWQGSWLGKELWASAGADGTLLPYIGGPEAACKLYRCPSLDKGVYCSGSGSNGLFDYSMFMCLSGARMDAIASTADIRMADQAGDVRSGLRTPLLVEEDPVQWLNNGCVDPGHSNTDRTGHYQYPNGTNYAAYDGSAHSLPLRSVGPTTHEWFTTAPSGAYLAMSSYVGNTGWGAWNSN